MKLASLTSLSGKGESLAKLKEILKKEKEEKDEILKMMMIRMKMAMMSDY